jgi:hypothetical protein
MTFLQPSNNFHLIKQNKGKFSLWFDVNKFIIKNFNIKIIQSKERDQYKYFHSLQKQLPLPTI